MSKRVKEFLDKLENDFPPMDQGYIVFQGGLFTQSVWYRFNLDLECWEWTYDLNTWTSVQVNENMNDPLLSADNGIIINYLKLKSLNKSIKMSNSFIKNLGDTVQELFIKYKSIEQIAVDPNFAVDQKIQDYMEKINFHFKELDRTNAIVSDYQNLILSEKTDYQLDRKNEETEKQILTNYNCKIILAKMDVIEHRLKISILTNNLKNRLLEIMEQYNKLDTYKLNRSEYDLTQISHFDDKHYISDCDNEQKNQIQNLKDTIDDYKNKYNKKCVILENYKSKNEDLLEKIKSLENNQENIKKIKSLELKVAKSEALKTELKFQINELEIQLSNNDSEIFISLKETEKLKVNNLKLSDDNIQLKQYLDSVLALCPQISFDEHDKVYMLKEDTYDMVDDKSLL